LLATGFRRLGTCLECHLLQTLQAGSLNGEKVPTH
jgi:hypothetical protein